MAIKGILSGKANKKEKSNEEMSFLEHLEELRWHLVRISASVIIGAFNVATLIQAADVAVKAANVTLMEIRLAMALGGKAFATLTGDVSSVQAAIDAGRAVIAEAGLLVNAVVIPRPHPNVYREII